jgi:hypothetical protein
MGTFEESIDTDCPVRMTQEDLQTYFFRRAVGQYGAPDTGVEWTPSDDALIDGEFDFEPTGGGTRITVKITYDPAELAADGGDEAALRQIVRAHLAHIRGYCGLRQHGSLTPAKGRRART